MESPGSCGLRRALLCGTSWGLTTIACHLGRALPGHDGGLLSSLLQLLLQTHSNRSPRSRVIGRCFFLEGKQPAWDSPPHPAYSRPLWP